MPLWILLKYPEALSFFESLLILVVPHLLRETNIQTLFTTLKYSDILKYRLAATPARATLKGLFHFKFSPHMKNKLALGDASLELTKLLPDREVRCAKV